MKGTYLGEFEELVLLSVAVLDGDAYGVSIGTLIEEESERTVTISTIHNVLYRLEKKGYVRSALGGATAERGGRNKRLFKVTSAGREVLEQSRALRNKLWSAIPQVNFQ
jgi:DNA-binding PadR family transcriptional regulator